MEVSNPDKDEALAQINPQLQNLNCCRRKIEPQTLAPPRRPRNLSLETTKAQIYNPPTSNFLQPQPHNPYNPLKKKKLEPQKPTRKPTKRFPLSTAALAFTPPEPPNGGAAAAQRELLPTAQRFGCGEGRPGGGGWLGRTSPMWRRHLFLILCCTTTTTTTTTTTYHCHYYHHDYYY